MSSLPPPALEAHEIRRAFDGREILRGASLALRPGRVTALLGPSGAGKSTLLRVLAGLEPVDGGEVRAGGRTLSSPGKTEPPERRRVGVVFQDYALFPHLTAAQNIAFGARVGTEAERRARAETLLTHAGLEGRARAYPHELSGGEQQRVALLRALASDPVAILMDEPFSNLDDALRRAMAQRTLSLLDEARDGRPAVLLVTHHAEEALFMADEVALMNAGRIIQAGPPMEVFLEPVSLVAAQLTGPVNAWTGTVVNGRLETPFGALAAPGLPDGARADAVVRPEALTTVPGAAARVVLSRPIGAAALVDLFVEGAAAVWRARVPVADAPAEGAMVDVRIDPTFARVRAAG
jgi:iron(III) transport system ATP-binding protein